MQNRVIMGFHRTLPLNNVSILDISQNNSDAMIEEAKKNNEAATAFALFGSTSVLVEF